nr:claudin-7-like isoform X1 [Ciona intestinalis]|eukprot:XP_018672566.1 claudin-7-like isoform X1 [Ciona intestinalis]
MASSALQVFGFTLGVLAWVGMIGTCASPEWRKNSHGQTLIDNTLKYEGLWVSCTAFVTGQTNCKDYAEFFVNLPQVLQICRALMISSIGTGFVAIIITVLGMKCVGLGSSNHIVKARIALLGGLLFGISGVLTGAAVSYYAQGVLQDYYNPSFAQGLTNVPSIRIWKCFVSWLGKSSTWYTLWCARMRLNDSHPSSSATTPSPLSRIYTDIDNAKNYRPQFAPTLRITIDATRKKPTATKTNTIF